jgi:hypothetical protein
MTCWYHGGISGLQAGDALLPSPPHVTDGCPVCVARAHGHVLTVGEYRAWLSQFSDRAKPVLEALGEADDREPVDPPSSIAAVYITENRDYALWYAARSGHGDLYEVEPLGPISPSTTDHFPSATCSEARVSRVLRRSVWLSDQERRRISRLWRKADEEALTS